MYTVVVIVIVIVVVIVIVIVIVIVVVVVAVLRDVDQNFGVKISRRVFIDLRHIFVHFQAFITGIDSLGD